MDFVTNKLRVIKNDNNDVIAYKIEILHQYLVESDLSIPQLMDNNFLINLIKMPSPRDLSFTMPNSIVVIAWISLLFLI